MHSFTLELNLSNSRTHSWAKLVTRWTEELKLSEMGTSVSSWLTDRQLTHVITTSSAVTAAAHVEAGPHTASPHCLLIQYPYTTAAGASHRVPALCANSVHVPRPRTVCS